MARPQALRHKRQPDLSGFLPGRQGVFPRRPRPGSGRFRAEHSALGHRSARRQKRQARHAGILHHHRLAGRSTRHRRHPEGQPQRRSKRHRARPVDRRAASHGRRPALQASAGSRARAIRRSLHRHWATPDRTRLPVAQAARRPPARRTARTGNAARNGTKRSRPQPRCRPATAGLGSRGGGGAGGQFAQGRAGGGKAAGGTHHCCESARRGGGGIAQGASAGSRQGRESRRRGRRRAGSRSAARSPRRCRKGSCGSATAGQGRRRSRPATGIGGRRTGPALTRTGSAESALAVGAAEN